MTGKIVDEIQVPEGMQVELADNDIKVSANGKENTRHFKSTNAILKKTDSKIEVWSKSGRKNVVAECKTVASHIKNLMEGLQNEFIYRLEVSYSHFPMNVQVKDGFVEINNLAGAKQARKSKILEGAKVEVKGKDITVSGHNKEAVGQTAANMEQATKIRGKDIRVYSDGIYITEKAKSAKGEE